LAFLMASVLSIPQSISKSLHKESIFSFNSNP
jgi:hypothetical protein